MSPIPPRYLFQTSYWSRIGQSPLSDVTAVVCCEFRKPGSPPVSLRREGDHSNEKISLAWDAVTETREKQRRRNKKGDETWGQFRSLNSFRNVLDLLLLKLGRTKMEYLGGSVVMGVPPHRWFLIENPNRKWMIGRPKMMKKG